MPLYFQKMRYSAGAFDRITMAFQLGIRRGHVWDDVRTLDSIIKKTRFDINAKSAREFELGFSQAVSQHDEKLNGKIISQFSKEAPVKSVYCFGKKHRPDLTINDDGIAVEVKFLGGNLDGIREAIGQCIFYRIRYRFVVNLLIVGQENKETYFKASRDEEKDLEEILSQLSKDMNIFTYLVPAFSAAPNYKTFLEWNELAS